MPATHLFSNPHENLEKVKFYPPFYSRKLRLGEQGHLPKATGWKHPWSGPAPGPPLATPHRVWARMAAAIGVTLHTVPTTQTSGDNVPSTCSRPPVLWDPSSFALLLVHIWPPPARALRPLPGAAALAGHPAPALGAGGSR